MNYLKKGWFLVLLSLSMSFLNGQGLKTIDKLKYELNQPLSDTAIAVRLASIGYQYAVIKPDSAVSYLNRALEMSRKINYKYGEALTMSNFGWVYRQKSDYKEAINILNKCNKIESEFPFIVASNLLFKAYIDFDLQEYSLASEKAIKARDIFRKINEPNREVVSSMVLIDILNVEKKYDAALKEAQDLYAYTFSNKIVGPYGIVSIKLARAYLKMGITDSASSIIDESFSWGKSTGNTRVVIFSQQLKSEMFSKKNEIDSAILYAQKGYETSIKEGFLSNALELSQLLVQLFSEKKNKDAAFHYEQIASQLKDSVYGLSKMTALQKLIVDQQNESFTIKEQNASLQNSRRQRLLFIIGSFFVIFSLFITWAYNKIRKEKSITEAAMMQLKSTQTQLIHSEKMASLGELTAGIAHEIQNPLNFVNNFSEVSSELIKELVDEVDKGNTTEVKAIAGDLVGNLEKINHHGQRAADIVKGMLQHSRSSSGTKEPTDINALCDEYLRLAYHGLRAKDKSFNAKFETSFDDSIGKINVLPQEIGRVILNLINNAFYAVNAKTMSAVASPAVVKYEPTVTVSTKKINSKIEISVADNGTGIPQKAVDKIFQPFFTTKPAGQGTGLGLSLSYDIVKAHGGELTVETKEGKGSTFTIFLPIVQA